MSKKYTREDKAFFKLVISGLVGFLLFVVSIWISFYLYSFHTQGTWMEAPAILTEFFFCVLLFFGFVAVNSEFK